VHLEEERRRGEEVEKSKRRHRETVIRFDIAYNRPRIVSPTTPSPRKAFLLYSSTAQSERLSTNAVLSLCSWRKGRGSGGRDAWC